MYLTTTTVTQHISISLLELNTFGHAVCALMIYLIWWEKPLDVDYPTVLQSRTLWKIAALRWMNQGRSPEGKVISNDRIELERSRHNDQSLSKVSPIYFPMLRVVF